MTQIIFQNVVTAGTAMTLSAQEDGYIMPGVLVGSATGIGVLGAGFNHSLTVGGNIYAVTYGMSLGSSALNDVAIKVNVLRGGSIFSHNYAVFILAHDSHVRNYGLIGADYAGVDMAGNAGAGSDLFNFGDIEGISFGVLRDSSTEFFRMKNFGTISGDMGSFSSNGTNVDEIINRGTLVGQVVLGNGNDSYDGRGGTVVGIIYGQGDNDTFICGLGEETIDGGGGIDLLDFSRVAAVTVSLANDVVGTRTAEGDFYTGIENVLGGRGNDKITGDGSANRLDGALGDDRVDGGIGHDTITGGLGVDTLTGAAGQDHFIFNALAEAGDTITDFAALNGSGDILELNAASFSGGLVPGALNPAVFVVRADNLAQTSAQRFIFNTTDKTLWFDSNGNLTGGLTLVADLQQSAATMTALDIVLI